MARTEEESDQDDLSGTPIAETEDRDAGEPMLLIVAAGTATDNAHRLLTRLRDDYGYGVVKEYGSEAQVVYSVTPAFDDEGGSEEG